MKATIGRIHPQQLRNAMICEGVETRTLKPTPLYWVQAYTLGGLRREFYRGLDYNKALQAAQALGIWFEDETEPGYRRTRGEDA
jgi:hypothetical protein